MTMTEATNGCGDRTSRQGGLCIRVKAGRELQEFASLAEALQAESDCNATGCLGGHTVSWWTYVITPGSALLFPSLCIPTGNLAGHEADLPIEYCGDRNAMMPRRCRTRRQDRADRVAAERRRDHVARTTRRTGSFSYLGPAPSDADDEPPPF
jgi:hypothetical protein